jgi:hypothetical protein
MLLITEQDIKVGRGKYLEAKGLSKSLAMRHLLKRFAAKLFKGDEKIKERPLHLKIEFDPVPGYVLLCQRVSRR